MSGANSSLFHLRSRLRRKARYFTSPPYGSRRYKVKKWAKAHALVTQATLERERSRAVMNQQKIARAQVAEVKAQIDPFLAKIASGLIEFDREQQAFRLTTFLGDGIVRSMVQYPGDVDRMWEYVGERLGHEVTRQLRSLDFGTIMRGPTVLIGDRFIDPWNLRPPYDR